MVPGIACRLCRLAHRSRAVGRTDPRRAHAYRGCMALTLHRAARSALDRLATRRAGDLLPLTDGALLAAAAGLAAPALTPLPWVAATLAPFLLYDADFTRRARTRPGTLALGFAGRLALLGACLAAIGFAARLPGPTAALLGWGAAVMLALAGSRGLLAVALRPRATARVPAERTERIADTVAVTVLADRPLGGWSAALKAGFDRALALVLAVLLLPVLGLIALAIRLDDPGPAIFRQRRHGLHNTEFDIYKFRTMRRDGGAGVLRQTRRGDPRVTRVGRFLRKWSLDELPQVFNVLDGSMSFVGPRPHAVDMRTEERLGPDIVAAYAHRHRMRPGITGWSQVNGARGATHTVAQLRRRIDLDLYYIEHWSPLLDLRILSRTAGAVLRATNAY